MGRVGKQRPCQTFLGYAAQIHHSHAGTHLAHNCEVMRNNKLVFTSAGLKALVDSIKEVK